MDVGFEHIGQRGIDSLMTPDPTQTLEPRRYDVQAEMAAAITGTGMAGMFMAVILKLDQRGLQYVQRRPDPLYAAFGHGRTGL